MQLWKTIRKKRRLPTKWDSMQTIWLPKPGKDTSQLRNKRSINLSDPALKGYLNFIQTHVRSAKLGAWQPTTYGGVPGKSAVTAILVVQEVMSRLVRAKKSFFMYMGDGEKAFDKLKRAKIWKATKRQLGVIPSIRKRMKHRHRRTIYTTKADNTMVEMEMTEGVAQGDPNGPGMFVMAYEDLGLKIDLDRPGMLHMSFEPPTSIILDTELMGNIPLHRHVYIDDLAEIHAICATKEIATLVTPIISGLEEWGFATNMKSICYHQDAGKGKQKESKKTWLGNYK